MSYGVSVRKRNWRWWAGQTAFSWRKSLLFFTTRNIATTREVRDRVVSWTFRDAIELSVSGQSPTRGVSFGMASVIIGTLSIQAYTRRKLTNRRGCHPCPKCKSTNARLAEIDEKLERVLKLTNEFETYKSRVKSLEDKHARKPQKFSNWDKRNARFTR